MRIKFVFRSALDILFFLWVFPSIQFFLAVERASVQRILFNPDGFKRQEVTILGSYDENGIRVPNHFKKGGVAHEGW